MATLNLVKTDETLNPAHCGRGIVIAERGRVHCSVIGCDWSEVGLALDLRGWQFLVTRDGEGYAAYVRLTETPGMDVVRRIGVAEDWSSVEPMLRAWCDARRRGLGSTIPTFRVTGFSGRVEGIRRER